MKKKMVSLLIALAMIIQCFNGNINTIFAIEKSSNSVTAYEETKETIENKSTKEVENNELDVAIVNYLAVKSYELAENKNNYIELENIKKLILNGIKLDGLKNEAAHKYVIDDFLPTLTKIELNSNARERAITKLNEKKTNAITKGAKATAEAMTSIDTSNIAGGIVGGIGAAGVGVSTYIDVVQEAQTEYNDLNFEIDQAAIEKIDGLKTKLFHYMIELTQNSNIRDEQIMRDQDIKQFYDAKTTTNIQSKIDTLNDIEKRLGSYGPYWLEKSKAYYQKAYNGKDEKIIQEDYKKSIEAFEKYEKLDNSLYRNGQNIEYYDYIPIYLESVEKVKSNDYINIATKYAKILDENIDVKIENFDKNMYLIALYKKLSEKTNNKTYLNNAYEIARKLTVKVATELKESNKNAYLSNKMPSQDGTVIACIYLLKDLAQRTNKTENELENLDYQIFGEDGTLFYNNILDTKLAFSNTELEKRRKKLFDNGLGTTYFSIKKTKSGFVKKSQVDFSLDKKLVSNEYWVDFEFKDNKKDFYKFDLEYDVFGITVDYKTIEEVDLLNEGGAILLHIPLSEVEKELLGGKIEKLRFRFDYGDDIDEDGYSKKIGWGNICSDGEGADIDAFEAIFGADYSTYKDQVSEKE